MSLTDYEYELFKNLGHSDEEEFASAIRQIEEVFIVERRRRVAAEAVAIAAGWYLSAGDTVAAHNRRDRLVQSVNEWREIQ